MPKLTINGTELTVENGATVIQAAERAGVYIPRYCYHPGLSLAGSCRMCLVEIENMPNLQIACYTRVQEGMKVNTESDRVKRARQSMLEFLLSNHPLDCPVCDQSGECDLQNFYMEHGLYQSRFLENKLKRKKAFPIGPHVMLDQERCILCTRCVRFTEEVSKSNELGVLNRGNRSVIDLFPGKALDNPYSGNVIDICPVGALTEREFRFQCRVWYLSTQESVCNGCARGCNIQIHYNKIRPYKAQGRRVLRIKPRFNADVNQWWICDEGRFGYGFIDQNRIESPGIRSAGQLEPATWYEALREAAELIKKTIAESGPDSIGVIASPQLSNEDLIFLSALFVKGLGVTQIALDNPWEKPGTEDGILRKADRNPNRAGALAMGISGDAGDLIKKAAEGKIRMLYIFGHDFADPAAQQGLGKAEKIVFQGPNWNQSAERADLVFPAATHAEKDGTFTNFEGRLQRFLQAFPPLEESLPDWEILQRLARLLGVKVPENAEEALQAWTGLTIEEIGAGGVVLDTAVKVGNVTKK